MTTRAVGSHKSNVGRSPIDNDANHNSRQGYVERWAPADTNITNIQFVIPSWLVMDGPGAQTPDAYSWTNSYSIEYPLGSGTIYPITWNNGQGTVTTTPGTGNYTSDVLALTIAADTPYAIRDWGQAQNLLVPTATVTVSGGQLSSTVISNPGTGLNTTASVIGSSSAPALTAAVPAGAGAGTGGAIGCTVVNGALTALPLTAGSGYTNGTYPIVFANGANMARCPYHITGVDWANHGTNLPDLTLSTASHTNDQLGFTAPMLIMAEQGTPAPAIGLIADSILDGSNDQTTTTTGWIGAFEKSIGRQHGHVEITQSGESLAQYINSHAGIQAMLLSSVTHLVCGLVRNDIGAGLSTIQTRLQTVWAPYLAAGIKVYQVTAMPTTTSTDGWATTTNQTPSASVAQQTGVNDWLRSNWQALGLSGVIDMCSVMESSLDSGLFNASAGGGRSNVVALTINGAGVVTACSIPSSSGYPISLDIPCEVFYPQGAPGRGLQITAHTDGSGVISSVTVNNGGSGHDSTNPPAVGMPGTYTNDGVHPSTYGHFKMIQAGLFAPSLFTLGGTNMGSGYPSGHLQNGRHGTLVFVRNNAPASNEYNGVCPKGGLVLDMVGGVIYQNTGTLDATTWGTLGGTFPAVVNAAALPTADPHSTGSVWSNSGVLTVSAG